jgi:Domain of unknown function (DUF2828)
MTTSKNTSCSLGDQRTTSTTDSTKEDKTEAAATSRPFYDAVVAEDHCRNKRIGENGMPEYTDHGIGSSVLALSQMVRGGNVDALVQEILSRNETQEMVAFFLLIFCTRNARGGKGEKMLSYDMFLHVWQLYPTTSAELLPLFAHYGYWKDLLLLVEKVKNSDATSKSKESFNKRVLSIMVDKLKSDVNTLEEYKKTKQQHVAVTDDPGTAWPCNARGPGISLLSKWLPREGSSLDKKIDFVGPFSAMLWPAQSNSAAAAAWQSTAKARYRREVAELTSYLALPEVLLAAQREDEIEFGRIASNATMRLRKVFLNETVSGRQHRRSENPKRIRLAEKFLQHIVQNGLKGKQLMPHEIVAKILRNYNLSPAEELVLDAQWKDLWKSVVAQIEAKANKADGGAVVDKFNPTRMIPMADVSGSMNGVPMLVSIALAIGLSEITHPAFQNLVLTFHSTPTFHKLNATDTIVQKVRSLAGADWGTSTDFEKAYDLILDVALRHNLKREDFPSLVVFSDMQFDEAASRRSQQDLATMNDVIHASFKKVAHELHWDDDSPSPIVYWNLRNTGGHPVDKDQEGAVLLSGFSPSLLKLVMQGDALKDNEIEFVQVDGTTVTKKVRVTPEEILRKMLDDKLYDPVRLILASSEEGALADYRYESSTAATIAEEMETGDFELV